MKDTQPRMCGECFSILNTMQSAFTGVAAYVHPIRVEGWEHDPQPVAVDERLIPLCDFCSQPGGAAEFETRKRVILKMGQLSQDMGKHWAACERCAAHIRSGSPHLLIDRATSVLPVPPGVRRDRPQQQALRRQIKALHMAFFEAEPTER